MLRCTLSPSGVVYDLQEPVSNSAYMLVYERVTPQNPDIAREAPADGNATPSTPAVHPMIRLDREVSVMHCQQPPRLLVCHLCCVYVCVCLCVTSWRQGRPWVPEHIASEVVSDNLAFLHDLHIYSPEFNSFIVQYCKQLLPLMQHSNEPEVLSCTWVDRSAWLPRRYRGDVHPPNDENLACCGVPDATVQQQTMHLLLLVASKVLARSSDVSAFGALCEAMYPLLTANPTLASLLLGLLLQDEALLKELLFFNTIHAVRAAVVDLLMHALRVLAPLETAALLSMEDIEVRSHRRLVSPPTPSRLFSRALPLARCMVPAPSVFSCCIAASPSTG